MGLSLSMSHSLGSGSSAEKAGILELDFGELLVAVHLNDEWHSQDQEGGAGDPRRLANAMKDLLRHDGGFEGSTLGVDHSLFPLRRPTKWTEKEITRSH